MNTNPINFGKRFIRQAAAIDPSTNKKVRMNFVEYEKTGRDLLQVVQTKKLWVDKYKENDTYIDDIADEFCKIVRGDIPDFNTRFYGLEDVDGQIQAICECGGTEIKLKRDNQGIFKPVNTIKYFTTNPKSMRNKKSREYKKLGASLLKEILKEFKKDKTTGVMLDDSSDGFWQNMPNFKASEFENRLICFLPKERFNDSIKKLNEVV